ncbi:transport protein Avl9-domain-containing protein [Phlyctochytrium arcticum]|nr:transport protein Avl9-domain-containing protein [Phlyctochytrium arcticum]
MSMDQKESEQLATDATSNDPPNEDEASLQSSLLDLTLTSSPPTRNTTTTSSLATSSRRGEADNAFGSHTSLGGSSTHMGTDASERPRTILHVLCVSFHHRNGPQVDFAFPPFPHLEHTQPVVGRDDGSAVKLPDEWSFLPFLCLPDGAHATDEEFIYFHLPPVEQWRAYPQSTLFGLACYRQMPAHELLHKTVDVTRSTVQKAVVVLATQPILGSVRSKLGLVTRAFFDQKDFSKLEILETLYQSLSASLTGYVPDSTLYMGISLRELTFKFKQKTMQLFKLLFLEKRILFFGSKVERLSAYQYSLVSLIPELLRNLQDAGSPSLGVGHGSKKDATLHPSYGSSEHLASQIRPWMPLPIFGESCFFQPYIPLQQMDVLMSSDTKSYLVGTSNSIFLHHKGCAPDAIANVDTGTLEIINPALHAILALTAPDKKFIDEMTKSVTATWSPEDDMSMNQQLSFEGSDDDIRSRFELYLVSLLSSVKTSQTAAISVDPAIRGKDFLADFNSQWVKAWQGTIHYTKWLAQIGGDLPDALSFTPAHPRQGASTFGMLQTSFAERLSSIGRNLSPLQQNVSKAVESGITRAVDTVTDPQQQQKIQATTNQLFANVSSYLAQKRKDWAVTPPSTGRSSPEYTIPGQESDDDDPSTAPDWEEVNINDEGSGRSRDSSRQGRKERQRDKGKSSRDRTLSPLKLKLNRASEDNLSSPSSPKVSSRAESPRSLTLGRLSRSRSRNGTLDDT